VHSTAARRFRRITKDQRTPVTTSFVISEAYTLIRYRLGSQPALGLLGTIRRSSLVQRVTVPESWEAAAEQLLEQYADQTFSYVDATSFITMRRLGIHEALSFDRDFVIAGFSLFGGA
jgi:predicted nucleic acid-binding protein